MLYCSRRIGVAMPFRHSISLTYANVMSTLAVFIALGGVGYALVRLGAGDYVQLNAYQDSGGSLNVMANSDYTPVFEMHWVSP